MISETFFASNYTSLWRTLTPTMEEFVRHANMHGYVREWIPLTSRVDQNRRALVNEAAFNLFSEVAPFGIQAETRAMEDGVERAFAAADKFVSGPGGSSVFQPTGVERDEAINICRRLLRFFTHKRALGLETAPRFKGCGIIRECVGDVLLGNDTLFEIKAGDRPFRSIDFRQMAIYCGLRFAESGGILRHLHLLNPRTGVVFGLDTDEFCHAVAGVPATTFCQNLVASFSASLVSD